MKKQIVSDLYRHQREEEIQLCLDIIDTCDRIADTEEESRCASAYIIIRSGLMVAIAAIMRHGGKKEDFMEIASQYWDYIKKAENEDERERREADG